LSMQTPQGQLRLLPNSTKRVVASPFRPRPRLSVSRRTSTSTSTSPPWGCRCRCRGVAFTFERVVSKSINQFKRSLERPVDGPAKPSQLSTSLVVSACPEFSDVISIALAPPQLRIVSSTWPVAFQQQSLSSIHRCHEQPATAYGFQPPSQRRPPILPKRISYLRPQLHEIRHPSAGGRAACNVGRKTQEGNPRESRSMFVFC